MQLSSRLACRPPCTGNGRTLSGFPCRTGGICGTTCATTSTSKGDPFKPYLHQRLSAGARNATTLHAEIVEQGYTGSYPILERYLKPLRRSDAATLVQVPRAALRSTQA